MLTFRKAVPADAPTIAEITHRAFKLYANEVSSLAAVNIKALDESTDAVLTDITDNLVLVAQDDSVIAGSIRVKRLSDDLAYIYRFGVDPNIRNTGIGSGLLQAAIDYCKSEDYAAIALHTNSKYFKLARYYYGKQFYVLSTSTEKGYVRALFIKELDSREFDVSPAYFL